MHDQVDPREMLANILAPPPPATLLRKGKVTSLVTGAVWAAMVATDGFNDRPRRMQWNGNGSLPAVGDAVYYYNASPVPLVIGRVPTANQDQNFGSGAVSGGSFVDANGNLRTDITSTSTSLASVSSTVSSLSSTVSSHSSSISSLNSSVSSLNSTVAGHTTTINSHTSSINTLNSTVAGHTTTINSHTSSLATQLTLIAQLQNAVANLNSMLAFYVSNMDYLARLGAHYSGHTAHPPGSF